MLNKDNVRELAYLTTVDAIEPIEGKDRVEAAVISGWKTMVKKGTFKPGDVGIYFEVDSKLPEKPEYEFTAKYHYKIKTQKFKQFYSQGLLMHPNDIGWKVAEVENENGEHCIGVIDNNDDIHLIEDETRFLTKQLEVTYAVAEDNRRKGSGPDKYAKMAKRHPNLFRKKPIRWLMRRTWGKKLLFIFFGKAKDKKGWPQWVVKTDEERVQNMPWVFSDPDWHDALWFATEKVDGTSTTFTIKRGKGRKTEFYICSRNVCFDTPEKESKCFYDTNVYTEMAEKYNIQEKIATMLNENKDLEFVTLQGETYGGNIQKRDYSTKEHQFMAFNLIFGYKDGTRKRMNPREMTDFLEPFAIPCVPIVSAVFKMPDTCDELLKIAEGNSMIDGCPREGLVFRDRDGVRSFKAVSNPFLVKYHQGD
jgi:hypothetical protein